VHQELGPDVCVRCLNYPWGGHYRTANRKPEVTHADFLRELLEKNFDSTMGKVHSIPLKVQS